jgi:hypothetical protein
MKKRRIILMILKKKHSFIRLAKVEGLIREKKNKKLERKRMK